MKTTTAAARRDYEILQQEHGDDNDNRHEDEERDVVVIFPLPQGLGRGGGGAARTAPAGRNNNSGDEEDCRYQTDNRIGNDRDDDDDDDYDNDYDNDKNERRPLRNAAGRRENGVRRTRDGSSSSSSSLLLISSYFDGVTGARRGTLRAVLAIVFGAFGFCFCLAVLAELLRNNGGAAGEDNVIDGKAATTTTTAGTAPAAAANHWEDPVVAVSSSSSTPALQPAAPTSTKPKRTPTKPAATTTQQTKPASTTTQRAKPTQTKPASTTTQRAKPAATTTQQTKPASTTTQRAKSASTTTQQTKSASTTTQQTKPASTESKPASTESKPASTEPKLASTTQQTKPVSTESKPASTKTTTQTQTASKTTQQTKPASTESKPASTTTTQQQQQTEPTASTESKPASATSTEQKPATASAGSSSTKSVAFPCCGDGNDSATRTFASATAAATRRMHVEYRYERNEPNPPFMCYEIRSFQREYIKNETAARDDDLTTTTTTTTTPPTKKTKMKPPALLYNLTFPDGCAYLFNHAAGTGFCALDLIAKRFGALSAGDAALIYDCGSDAWTTRHEYILPWMSGYFPPAADRSVVFFFQQDGSNGSVRAVMKDLRRDDDDDNDSGDGGASSSDDATSIARHMIMPPKDYCPLDVEPLDPKEHAKYKQKAKEEYEKFTYSDAGKTTSTVADNDGGDTIKHKNREWKVALGIIQEDDEDVPRVQGDDDDDKGGDGGVGGGGDGGRRRRLFFDMPLRYMIPLLRYDLRRMSVALAGPGPASSWAATKTAATMNRPLRAAVQFEETYLRAEAALPQYAPSPGTGAIYRVPIHEYYTRGPVFPNVELDDVAIHFRCGDLLLGISSNERYYVKFSEYTNLISPEARSVGIVTQPFSDDQEGIQARIRDQVSTSGDRCSAIVHGLIDHIRAHAPAVERISIHNGSNETIALAWARLIMANQTLALSPSTFSAYPAVASFGTGYLAYHGNINNDMWLHNELAPTLYDDENLVFLNFEEKLGNKALDEMWKTERGPEKVLEWFQS